MAVFQFSGIFFLKQTVNAYPSSFDRYFPNQKSTIFIYKFSVSLCWNIITVYKMRNEKRKQRVICVYNLSSILNHSLSLSPLFSICSIKWMCTLAQILADFFFVARLDERACIKLKIDEFLSKYFCLMSIIIQQDAPSTNCHSKNSSCESIYQMNV